MADMLRKLAPEELEIGVCYLAGLTRQGRSGIGWATLREAQSALGVPAAELTLIAVDATLSEIARMAGPGSTATRTRLLSGLLARATTGEQEFLKRLLMGEL